MSNFHFSTDAVRVCTGVTGVFVYSIYSIYSIYSSAYIKY